jgi:hypothetical protein
MTTKKRATPKVAEAAPTYRATSAKTIPGALGEALWEIFSKLSDEEQGAFIEKMLETPEWREDMMDICTVMQRRNDPTIPYEEFREELRREGLL